MGRTTFRGETLGERLRWAIERQPAEGKRRGVGLLISRLEGRGAPGANYPSINSYLSDKVRPPLDFLEAAADALGVRVEWLAFRHGAPTEEEEAAGFRGEEGDSSPSLLDRAYEAIPELEGLNIEVAPALVAYTIRMAAAWGRAAEKRFTRDNFEELVQKAWGMVTEPAAFWAEVSGRRVPWDPREYSDFVMAMIQALSIAQRISVPERTTLAEIKSWKPLSEEEFNLEEESTLEEEFGHGEA